MTRQDMVNSVQSRISHHVGIIALANGPKSDWAGNAVSASFFFGGRDRRAKIIKHEKALLAEAEAELAALSD